MTSQIAGIDVLCILVRKVLTSGDVVILGMTSEDGMIALITTALLEIGNSYVVMKNVYTSLKS